MNEIIVEMAKPNEYKIVCSKVYTLLSELFPEEQSYACEKCVSAVLTSNNRVWAFVARKQDGEI